MKNPVEVSYFGKPEVSNDYMPFIVKKYVLWLEVSVDNVVAMEVGEGRDDLGRIEPHTGEGEPPGSSEVIEELTTGNVGEQQVKITSVYTGPEEFYQEWMFDVLKYSALGRDQVQTIIVYLQYFLLVLHVLNLLQLQDFLN